MPCAKFQYFPSSGFSDTEVQSFSFFPTRLPCHMNYDIIIILKTFDMGFFFFFEMKIFCYSGKRLQRKQRKLAWTDYVVRKTMFSPNLVSHPQRHVTFFRLPGIGWSQHVVRVQSELRAPLLGADSKTLRSGRWL